ncbi:citrate:proton symporter [Sphingomonas sp. QA11]|uniref:CitMHS family transporter n=1 Tax=Sphingomonas sp. QA11 TaxID=2950605 RepID=UPI00234A7350|nr:citrate:proton symporter [Sphingomonas sp. QA11]WCM25853.1 citrate:proton symporter [Sphingomonas sp. QA11]
MSIAVLGFLMVIVLTVVVMTRRVTAVAALILVPIAFALLAGAGTRTPAMMLEGIKQVAPTGILLVFAILYFGLMIDAGLFKPLVGAIVRWVGSDPRRATIGQAAIASTVGLDGDGTTTTLVGASSILPVYRRLQMDIMVYAVIGSLSFIIMNMTPWGGPVAKIAATLRIDPNTLFLPMLPVLATGLLSVFALAWWLGGREYRRLADGGPTACGSYVTATDASQAPLGEVFVIDENALRPKLLLVNFGLTAVVMACVVLHLAPLPVTFMVGFSLALVINYPGLPDQRKRIMAHAGNALSVALLVLAAGAFTGIMSGTGMTAGMAKAVILSLPDASGPYLALITALISIPMNFFLSSDAFYFGVLPVIAEAGAAYGISAEEIGRASLLGQPVHGLSPLVPAVYLKCAILGIELADFQRFAIRYSLGLCLILITAALLFGAIPLFH